MGSELSFRHVRGEKKGKPEYYLLGCFCTWWLPGIAMGREREAGSTRFQSQSVLVTSQGRVGDVTS